MTMPTMSERRACTLIAADRKMIRYRPRRPPDLELRARLRDLANQRRRFGYRRLFILLREQGEPSGINRIYRLYREEGLTVRKRKARRRWLCLERQDLSQSLESCLCYHGHPLERTEVLRSARQDITWGAIMKAGLAQPVRCAIYTRVSTDQGLEQDFNSLDAQYDPSQDYIRSQAHAGWTLSRTKYDDGGFSGGNTDRPALQQLLEDVRTSKVDVIVVYKVDRLTRSLADFAKLVELFDQHGVSFVSVTQQFNTTTSMGRLTLNVLLSFAQFEREVTSERIRDKIAASKRKGLWVGDMVPLGYE